jgi:3-dehydrotetronate 4-kinase
MTPKLGIIADDFTGAILVAGMLETAGVSAPVSFNSQGISASPESCVLILATRTRVYPVEEALITISDGAAALRAAGCTSIAYKACASFDSTATGNIGPAAILLSDEAGGRSVLMSAGFPRYNVSVHQGYLFYRGRLLSESVKRYDPLTPMEDPDLARFLSLQIGSDVVLLPHSKLRQGLGAATAAWRNATSDGIAYVLADTSDDGDVEITADLAFETGAVVVASDPVIVGVGLRIAGTRRALPQPISLPDGPGAVLVGSVGPTALAQIARFAQDHPVLSIDPADAREEEAIIGSALIWAGPRVGAQPFCIASMGDEAAVARAQTALGVLGAARRAERLMGGIARGLRDLGVRRLVVSGGETSGAVVAALGLVSVRVLPEGPLDSGFCVAEHPVRMGLFLKSGKIGDDDILIRGLDALDPKGS